MDGKAEADAEEARYVQSKPPLGPEGGPQGIRTDIRPGHGESDISRLLRFVLFVLVLPSDTNNDLLHKRLSE